VYIGIFIVAIGFGFVTFESDDAVERATNEQYMSIQNKKVCKLVAACGNGQFLVVGLADFGIFNSFPEGSFC
jgi:hypothetical protein